MQKPINPEKGFTLVELLVVVSIIGILAGLLLANLAGIRERARDAKRKAELSEIKKALRLYYNDYQRYPDDSSGRIVGCGASGDSDCAWGDGFTAGGVTYMGQLPNDPLTGTYTYSQGADTDNFCLTATIENDADQDIARSQDRCDTACGISDTTTYVVCGE